METGGNDRRAGQSLNSEINVTPLVDVMLVVFIIFIVVTPLLQQGVSVALPLARNVEEASTNKGQAVTVVLQEDGQLLLEADPIDWKDLPAALQTHHWSDPGREFQIKADRREIKRVLQAGREAGYRGAALIAQEIGTRRSADRSRLAARGQGD